MASASDILADGLDRVHGVVHDVVDGLDEDGLTYRVDAEANTIAWLVWHLTRVQDDHVSEVADVEQRWTAGGWHHRFGLPFAVETVGYGHSADEVGQVRGVPADLLIGYFDEVHAASRAFVAHVSETDLDRVVDDNWDPPVTLAVRLLSVVDDDAQHAGQAAFVRGVWERLSASG